MRRPVIAANWKMHKTVGEAVEFVRRLAADEVGRTQVEVVLCPPFTALSAVAEALRGSAVSVGAQDLFWEPQGAFTGEVSASMLVDVGCRFVIIGHSERRQHFGETDETVRRKLIAALGHGLTPIACIGETLAEREADRTHGVLARQLEGALQGLTPEQVGGLVFAYEPVWAIGTGRNATPEQAQDAHAFIRRQLARSHGERVADAARIQYGGSVNPANAAGLLQQPDVDGALVGGASLSVESFRAIVNAALNVKVPV